MKVEIKDLFTKKSYMQFAEELKPQFPTSFPFEYPENYYHIKKTNEKSNFQIHKR